jgi:xanthine dehydrogenase YagS FAD-binding subunit
MRPFEYARPATGEQAVALLAAAGAAPLGGGSDLLTLIKDGVESPGRLVGLTGIAGLAEVTDGEHELTLGALATVGALARHSAVARAFPALAAALASVASPQIRTVGTLGGNLCQRPRCWYYRSGFGLLAQRDGRSLVVDGDNRYHAILGNDGPAYFVSPSTVAPLLLALDARARLLGPQGERTIDVADLYRIPRAAGESELTLAAGEIVTHVVVPKAAGRRSACYEIRPRRSLDWSLATAAVALDFDAGKVSRARVVLGQVAPRPWRALGAEAALAGRAVDAKVAAEAGEAAVAGARALSRNRYKIQLAATAVRRAVLAAAGKET